MKDFDKAREICKNHGVKGFRKLALKRTVYVAGKQCASLSSFIAHRVLDRLIEEGYTVADLRTCRELAEKGLLDCVSIS